MPGGPLLAASTGALAAACIGAAVLVFRGDGTSRRLEARMRSIAQQAAVTSGATTGRGPDIRRPASGGSTLARTLERLGRSPYVPAERRLPWPAVLVACGMAALGAAYFATTILGAAASPIAGLGAGTLLIRGIFKWELQRYRNQLFLQIPEAMGLILRAIRAGLPMGEAVSNVARETASPTREEFGRVVSAISIGQPVDAALFTLAERTGLTEYFFFAVTVGLQASTGGNLGETLENLAEMVRKRVAMAGRVKAVTAEARMSALILVLLPFVAGGAISLMTPGYLAPLFHSDFGFKMLLIGIALLLSGILIIRGLLRSAVAD